MTNETMGARIARLRRQKNLTQDALAESLNVSAQAVSKWENDVSCPDITLLPRLAKMLGVTVDVLLSGEAEPPAQVIPVEKRKSLEDMMLRLYIHDGEDREEVRISIPMTLLKLCLESGIQPQFTMSGKHISAGADENGKGADMLQGIDFQQILQLVQSGLLGTLMEIDVSDGTRIRIVVE